MRLVPTLFASTLGFALLSAAACGGGARDDGFGEGDSGTTPGTSSGTTPPPDSGTGFGETDSGGGGFTGDPKTCAQAAEAKSYVGCDYWPTVTYNSVFTQFDFAVVVSNVGDTEATVTVTGPNGTNETATVAPQSLSTIELPWVSSLKGVVSTVNPITGSVGAPPNTASVLAAGGAYHLVSDVPVVVYQFSPLQYKQGSTLSYTNDASLLLPSTAMTGTYRIMSLNGLGTGAAASSYGNFVAITGTQDGTTVEVKLSATAGVLAGDSIPATDAGGTVSLTLNAGDVAQLLAQGGVGFDPSGGLIRASAPVQVITGTQIAVLPNDKPSGDHLEETVFPAETLGSRYLVQQPMGPTGQPVAQRVRMYGNVDGTTLTYSPSKPTDCPDTLAAGQVAVCGSTTSANFEVKGDHEFGVGLFQLGCTLVDPTAPRPKGDPSQSFSVAVEQYRSSYVFLAPTDYDVNFVDVIAPVGATISLDDEDVSDRFEPFEGTDFVQAHLTLENGSNGGSHSMKGSLPFGIQVLGYGEATSYQYPGGLNLGRIAPPPVN